MSIVRYSFKTYLFGQLRVLLLDLTKLHTHGLKLESLLKSAFLGRFFVLKESKFKNKSLLYIELAYLDFLAVLNL